jgi:hypothetical protein
LDKIKLARILNKLNEDIPSKEKKNTKTLVTVLLLGLSTILVSILFFANFHNNDYRDPQNSDDNIVYNGGSLNGIEDSGILNNKRQVEEIEFVGPLQFTFFFFFLGNMLKIV